MFYLTIDSVLVQHKSINNFQNGVPKVWYFNYLCDSMPQKERKKGKPFRIQPEKKKVVINTFEEAIKFLANKANKQVSEKLAAGRR